MREYARKTVDTPLKIESLISSPSAQERKEQLLEKLHESALAGLHLLDYLETEMEHSLENFLETRKTSDPLPEYTQTFFKETIARWEALRERTNKLFSTILAELSVAGKEPTEEEIAKRLFHLRGCERDPLGKIQIIRKGAYLVIVCDKIEDYSSFYRGQKSPTSIKSGGTYHKALPFIWRGSSKPVETTSKNPESDELPPPIPAWDPESDDPPPIPDEEEILQSLEIPVLLVRPSEVRTLDVTIRHEQQHFLNDAFQNLYHGKGTRQESSFKRLQDEILAGIREGLSGDWLRKRLGKQRGDTYTLFVGGTAEEVQAHERILNELCTVLDEPFTASLFHSVPNRTLLAFHLMHVPLERTADRIRLLSAFFKKQIPVTPLETEPDQMPFDVEKLVRAVPAHLQAYCSQQGNVLITCYKNYQQAQRRIVSEPSLKTQTDIQKAYKQCHFERDQIFQKVLPWYDLKKADVIPNPSQAKLYQPSVSYANT